MLARAIRSWSAGDRDNKSMILCSCSRALAPEPRKGAQSESGEEWGGRRSGASRDGPMMRLAAFVGARIREASRSWRDQAERTVLAPSRKPHLRYFALFRVILTRAVIRAHRFAEPGLLPVLASVIPASFGRGALGLRATCRLLPS